MEAETWPLEDGGSGADLTVLVSQDSENRRTLPSDSSPQPTESVKRLCPSDDPDPFKVQTWGAQSCQDNLLLVPTVT